MSDDYLLGKIKALEQEMAAFRKLEVPSPTWITYASTVSGSTGSAGTYAEVVYRSRYYTLGHICHVQVSKQIINVGSWTGAFRVLRPITAANNSGFGENGKIITNGGLTPKALVSGSTDLYFGFATAWGVTALPWGGAGFVVNDWIEIDSIYEI